MVFSRMWLIPLLLLVVWGGVAGGSGDIGDFNIDKVREAVDYSDTGLGEANMPAVEQESITSLILRISIYLVVVILLIVAIAWLIRRQGMFALRGNSGGAMDVIETLPIGQNRTVSMVRVMDEIYLISQTPAAITLLDKISGEKAVEVISASRGGGTIMPFKDAFNNFMGKIRKPS